MRKITVAHALKERKRLEERIQQYRSLVREQNCILEGSCRVIDVDALMKKCEMLEKGLLNLRLAIAQANISVSEKLIELDLLKKKQKFIAMIPCDETSIERCGEERLLRKEAFIKAQQVLDMNEEIKDRIDAIQDELDQFNATEYVTVDD